MKNIFLLLMLVVSMPVFADFLPSTFSAQFEQRYISTLTGKISKSKGTIDYKYPGHIKFDVVWPDPTLFVANPEKSWQYTPPFIPGEKGQVAVRPSKNLMLFKFFDVLKEGLKTNHLYEVVEEKDSYTVNFKGQTVDEIGLVKTKLFFSKKENPTLLDLTEAVLSYKDKREVTLKFIDMRTEVEFPENYFVFDEKANPVAATTATATSQAVVAPSANK